jgi:uncharacterized protein (DUF952 family)
MTRDPIWYVYHLCTRPALEAARAAGVYRAASLDTEGFIHLSRAHQVAPTAQAYFADVPDVVVLVIDPARVASPIKYEAPAPLPSATPKAETGALYPHCYGAIEIDAIVDVRELEAWLQLRDGRDVSDER